MSPFKSSDLSILKECKIVIIAQSNRQGVRIEKYNTYFNCEKLKKHELAVGEINA